MRLGTAAALVGGLIAAPALASNPVAKGKKTPGSLVVVDTAKVFTEGGIDKAKDAFANTHFDKPVNLTVETFPEIPADKKAAFDAATDKRQFFANWAKEVYKSHKDTGLYVLICMKPEGIYVLPDRETAVGRGFSNEDVNALYKKLAAAFNAAKTQPEAEAKATRDKGLMEGTEFVVSQLEGTAVGAGSGGKAAAQKSGGMPIMGWACLGLAGLLGAWLVIGLIRAFTSGGGAGGGPGGGGFMTSLFGGLFGAMAGMWMYNQFFGGGGMFGGSDAHAGDAGGGDMGGDTGAGDVGGDYGGGGDFGGGDWGGGDFGGGDF
jgi:uncharacterized protein